MDKINCTIYEFHKNQIVDKLHFSYEPMCCYEEELAARFESELIDFLSTNCVRSGVLQICYSVYQNDNCRRRNHYCINWNFETGCFEGEKHNGCTGCTNCAHSNSKGFPCDQCCYQGNGITSYFKIL